MSSNSGVNAGCAKCFIVFMAVVILIQGCVYLGLSIWGLTMEKCSEQVTSITTNPFGFAVDLIYFANKECAPNITIKDTTASIEMDWAKSFEITNRMFIFMITYAVVSGLWIVTSLFIIVTICCAVTKTILGVCYWPWFLLIIAGSILDVVATGYHIHDIVHTTTANDTLLYIGATNLDPNVQSFLEGFDPYFVTPAIVMTCISSRVVLIWLLNIFGSSFCLSFSQVLAKRNSSSSRRDNLSPSNTSTVARDRPAQLSAQQHAQRHVPSQNNEQYPPPQIKPKPLPIQAAMQQPQLSQQQGFNKNQNIQQNEPSIYEPASSSSSYAYVVKSPTPDFRVSNTAQANDLHRQTSGNVENMTYRNTDTHPDRLDYPSTPVSLTAPPLSADVQKTSPQLSAASALNNRYSAAQQYSQSQNQPQRVSAELRSQLPWSYTSMQAKPPAPPRKPQIQIYPDIPESDYSVHSGTKEQRSTTSDIEENNATQQQQPSQSYSRW